MKTPSGATLRRTPSEEYANQTRNDVQNVERPVKIFAISLVLAPTLHRADGPLLFWLGSALPLALGSFRYAGRSVRRVWCKPMHR